MIPARPPIIRTHAPNSASFGTPGPKYGLMPIRDFQVPPRTFSLQAAIPGRLAQVV